MHKRILFAVLLCALWCLGFLQGCVKVYEEGGETKVRPGTIEVEHDANGESQ